MASAMSAQDAQQTRTNRHHCGSCPVSSRPEIGSAHHAASDEMVAVVGWRWVLGLVVSKVASRPRCTRHNVLLLRSLSRVATKGVCLCGRPLQRRWHLRERFTWRPASVACGLSFLFLFPDGVVTTRLFVFSVTLETRLK